MQRTISGRFHFTDFASGVDYQYILQNIYSSKSKIWRKYHTNPNNLIMNRFFSSEVVQRAMVPIFGRGVGNRNPEVSLLI
jgi:hypothetical protein